MVRVGVEVRVVQHPSYICVEHRVALTLDHGVEQVVRGLGICNPLSVTEETWA